MRYLAAGAGLSFLLAFGGVAYASDTEDGGTLDPESGIT